MDNFIERLFSRDEIDHLEVLFVEMNDVFWDELETNPYATWRQEDIEIYIKKKILVTDKMASLIATEIINYFI